MRHIPLEKVLCQWHPQVTAVLNIPYNRKYWRKLNLVVQYRITICIYVDKKFWRILIWRLLRQSAKLPNLIPHQIFRLYGNYYSNPGDNRAIYFYYFQRIVPVIWLLILTWASMCCGLLEELRRLPSNTSSEQKVSTNSNVIIRIITLVNG